MTTKDELITGLHLLINEGKRIGERFTDDEWTMAADEGGWTNKQVLAHLAAVGGIVVPFVSGVASAPPGTDLGANMNVDAMNAQFVSQRDGKTVPELVNELETAYGGVIDYVRNAPDALLTKRATVGGYQDMTIGDLMMQMVVLHGLAHVYHTASRL